MSVRGGRWWFHVRVGEHRLHVKYRCRDDFFLFSEREATRAFGPIWRTAVNRRLFFRVGRVTVVHRGAA